MRDLRQLFRRNLYPQIDKPLEMLGLYAQYELHEKERIGSCDCSKELIVSELQEIGYEYNSLSASKLHPDSKALDIGSYRRIPETYPNIHEGTKILEWPPEQTQYHIHLFEIDGNIELFSHYR